MSAVVKPRLSLAVAVAVVIGLAWVFGCVPTPARVTLSGCTVSYGPGEVEIRHCDGSWDRGLGRETGAVGNVDFTGWKVVSVIPQEGSWKMNIPDSQRQYPALVAYGAVVVQPGWLVVVAMVLVGALFLAPLVVAIRWAVMRGDRKIRREFVTARRWPS
jgi:hypothetical protein